MKKSVTIVGAGLVGSLLSIYLSKRGYRTRIYERRPDIRKEKLNAGRTINLALSDRGIRALEEVGIMGEIRTIAIPMHGRCIHNTDDNTTYQPYGNAGQFINSVSRGELNKKLMDLAERHGAELYFNHRCEKIDYDEKTVSFELPGGKIKTTPFELLFGADGAFSAVRLHYQLHHDRFQYEQQYIDFGYKELTIPPEHDGSWKLEKNALHIWPRGNYMLIALPNMDGSFTCTLFFPFQGEPSFATINNKEKLSTFFYSTFKSVAPLITALEDEFFNNPTSSLVTIKCFPWVLDDKLALIGDAAHGIVPFFGQGMNCGFEDCSVFNNLMEKYHDDWFTILREFQLLRKPDTDAIAELALNNFVEMRDKVADPQFLLQKKIEAKLNEKYPDKWIPAYSQVTFSPQIRYSDARRNSMRQEFIMRKVMEAPNIGEVWNDDNLHQQIIQQLTNSGMS